MLGVARLGRVIEPSKISQLVVRLRCFNRLARLHAGRANELAPAGESSLHDEAFRILGKQNVAPASATRAAAAPPMPTAALPPAMAPAPAAGAAAAAAPAAAAVASLVAAFEQSARESSQASRSWDLFDGASMRTWKSLCCGPHGSEPPWLRCLPPLALCSSVASGPGLAFRRRWRPSWKGRGRRPRGGRRGHPPSPWTAHHLPGEPSQLSRRVCLEERCLNQGCLRLSGGQLVHTMLRASVAQIRSWARSVNGGAWLAAARDRTRPIARYGSRALSPTTRANASVRSCIKAGPVFLQHGSSSPPDEMSPRRAFAFCLMGLLVESVR